MKKFFLPLVLFAAISTLTVQAQDYKPFRVGLGLGFASPAGEGAKGGVLFYAEPSYRVKDNIAVGLKGELAVMLRGTTVVQSGTTSAASGKVSAAGSYTVNGQYYFMNSGFRPFAGLGLGIYSLASASFAATSSGSSSTSSSSDAVSAGTKFGFYPRIGFDAGHFTLNIEYNIIPKSTNSFTVNTGTGTTTATSETKNNYLGFRLGFFIGGGKKK
jgi:outer membrane protein W